jgi:hypothetical protein
LIVRIHAPRSIFYNSHTARAVCENSPSSIIVGENRFFTADSRWEGRDMYGGLIARDEENSWPPPANHTLPTAYNAITIKNHRGMKRKN